MVAVISTFDKKLVNVSCWQGGRGLDLLGVGVDVGIYYTTISMIAPCIERLISAGL